MPKALTAILAGLGRQLGEAVRRPANVALRVGEVGLAICLLLTPFLLGGRHDGSRLVYVAGGSLAALGMLSHAALTGRRPRVPAWVLATLAGAIALVTLQVVPLPGALLSALNPGLGELLPMWGDGAAFGPWRTLSVTPAETREALGLLLTHGMLTIGLLLRVRDMEDVQRLLPVLSAAAIAMAALGFVQHAFGDGTLAGVYDHPRRDFTHVQGAFANKNHFAHFLLLGIGPTVWLAFRYGAGKVPPNTFRRLDAVRLWRVAAWVGAIALLVVGVLASQCRGGVASLGIATIVAVGLLHRAAALRTPQVAAAVVAAVAVLAGVSLVGYESISGRVDDLFSGEIEKLDSGQARRAIWKANASALAASPWVGFGAGSHREVYPAFIDQAFSREFTHAESGYLQVASEAGGLGLLLLAVACIGLVATVTRGALHAESRDARLMWVAIAPGVVCSLMHSVVDFVWYLPGLLGPTIAIAVAAIRLAEHSAERPSTVRTHNEFKRYLPVGAAAMAASIAVGVAWGPALASGHWDSVQRAAVARRGMVLRLMHEEPQRADPMLASTIQATSQRMTDLLVGVLKSDPSSATAHQLLATRLAERFETRLLNDANGMTLDLVADTVRRGGFRSRTEKLAWLERAYGEDARLLFGAARHAEQAVMLSPLQGEAYLRLASLDFLLEGEPDALDLTAQALKVRPRDGDVHFEAGRRLWLAGDFPRAIEHWREAMEQPGGHVAKLVAHFARIAPASEFVNGLSPSRFALSFALTQYSICGEEADMLALSDYAVSEAERLEAEGEEPAAALAHRWLHASFSLRHLGRTDEAVRAAERAVALSPHLFSMRRELAHTLRLAERFEEADTHIRWCLARRPDLRYLRAWLEESAKRRTLVDRNRRRRHGLFESVASKARADDDSSAAVRPGGLR